MLSTKDILEFVKKYDDTFGAEKNIYYAGKAFKTNSIINYLSDMKERENLDYEEAEQILGLLIKYLRGEADVIWDEGKVLFKLIQGAADDQQQDSKSR